MNIDNISFLKNSYPEVYGICKDIEEGIEDSNIKEDTAFNSQPSLYIDKVNYRNRIHSQYNPSFEADVVLAQYQNIDQYDHILFYGTGLGYHIDLLLEKHPDKKIYIYEPIKELFYYYTDNRLLPKKSIINICIDNKEKNVVAFINDIMKKTANKVLIIELPSHKNIFKNEYNAFFNLYSKMLKDKRSSLHTNYAFQKRWTLNSMLNFKEVLNTPNVILNKKGQFNGKPAMLVAAGPSLNLEIENLRIIKEKGLAYIFTVGSANKTLIHHGIYPDAVCTYDPQAHNHQVFSNIIENGISEIPLIFGSSVGYETLRKYPGKKLHMITSQDSVASYYLKSKAGDELDGVLDAPTIAIITLQLLYKLGFGKIILVGQNLAYLDNKYYAEAIDYGNKVNLDEQQQKSEIKVKDVYGNDIYTEDNFTRMRAGIEEYINQFEGVEVVNSTRGGAHIEGAKFIPLEKIIEKDLNFPVVDESWLLMDDDMYDTHYMKAKMDQMIMSYGKIESLLLNVNVILEKISKLCKNKNFKQVDKMYVQLDKAYKKIDTNDYFRVFIIPMNRVFYKLLLDELAEIKFEKNMVVRAEKIINSLGRFIFECKKDIKETKELYEAIHECIEGYVVGD